MKRTALAQAIALVLSPLVVANAFAADVYLRAGTTTMTMPDNNIVTMWGFAPADATGTATGPITVPGPAITVPAGDNVLNVTLFNDLPVPVSIVIPGQITAMTPATFTDGQGRERVRSFTAETASGTSNTYSWNSLQPGTYLYESGTHPAVQVQMGLYGAVKHDSATGAYPGVAYDSDVVMLYSEIDPALHAAVANNTYGTASYPSTINYSPQYFLINGRADGDLAITGSDTGKTTLLRFLNAGLRTRVPVMLGLDMKQVAEDGKPFSNARSQYSAMLAAGKTIDASVSPLVPGTYTLQERRVNSNNLGSELGGNIAQLTFGGVVIPTPPTTVADAYSVSENVLLNVAAPGVLSNDTGTNMTAGVSTLPTHGSLTLNSDGSFTYLPTLNYSGPDQFSYIASANGLNSAVTNVALTVNKTVDLIANADSYATTKNTTLNVAAAGVLGNDSGVAPLTASVVSTTTHGTLTLNGNGSFSYVPTTNYIGPDSFTYRTNSGSVSSLPATVSIAVNDVPPPGGTAPVANGETLRVAQGSTWTIPAPGVLANDTDADGNALTAALNTTTSTGALTLNSNGGLVYATPSTTFVGLVTFTYHAVDSTGLSSNVATTTLNVAANRRPTVRYDSRTMRKNTLTTPRSLKIAVLGNDYDPDADANNPPGPLNPAGTLNPASVVIATAPDQGGKVVVNVDGTVTYTPKLGFVGTEKFYYRVRDMLGLLSYRALVSVTVTN